MTKNIYIYGSSKELKLFLKNKYEIYSEKNNNESFIMNMKENNIDTLYITYDFINVFDNNFYQKCKRIGINILNDRIDFLGNHIDKIIRYNLKIPILKKSKQHTNYSNLVIESLDMKYPILLRTNKGKTILHKLKDANEIIKYKDYLTNFIDFFDGNDQAVYLQYIPEKFVKIKVFFLGDQILDCYKVLYSFLGEDIIMESYPFVDNVVKEDLKNIVEYFKLKFGCIEFIIDCQSKNTYFYSIQSIDKLFNKRELFIKIFGIDLYEIKFGDYSEIKPKIKSGLILMNEIIFNYNDFMPFYRANSGKKKLYYTKKLHIKKKREEKIKEDILLLLKSTTNILFKEICYSDIGFIDGNKTYIRNLYNVDQINIMNIVKCDFIDNVSVCTCSDHFILDKYNSRIANFMVGNNPNRDCQLLQIKNSDIELVFMNKTYVCVTGSTANTEVWLEGKMDKTYNVVEVSSGSSLVIKKTDIDSANLNYIAVSNGFLVGGNKIFSMRSCIIKSRKILFNKPSQSIIINPKQANILIPKIGNNYGLKVIESSFTDKFNKKVINFIYSNKWNVEKINDKTKKVKLTCKGIKGSKYINKLYEKYSVQIKDKKYRYSKGTVVLNKQGLFIVTSSNYDYYDGLSIFNIISSELWKLNYLKNISVIGFLKCSLSFTWHQTKVIENIIGFKTAFVEKKSRLDDISETKLLLLSYLDKNNLITVEIRLMGDNHLLVDYSKIKSSSIKDNLFIEYSFRQKIIEEYVINRKIKNIDKKSVIFGLNSYIINCEGVDREKLALNIYKIEKEIGIKKEIQTRKIKLPIILDKKYFSEEKYVNSLLRINNIEKKSDIKQFIEKMRFIIVDINSINPNSFSLIPYDPRNRLFLIQRNINKTVENGTISIGKFFTNVHYERPITNEAITIIGKTIPVFNKKDKSFILRRFDIVTFELITNSAFYSILNHNNLGKYYIDIRSYKFDISDYRNFFTMNQKNFIHHKQKAIEIYNKEKDMYVTNDSKSFIDIYDVMSPETCYIDEIYVGLNNVVKIGDKLCKIVSYNYDENGEKVSKTKFIIKSNVDGLITKIDIVCGKDIKKGRTIMSILRY